MNIPLLVSLERADRTEYAFYKHYVPNGTREGMQSQA
jgi:hypothetical protein